MSAPTNAQAALQATATLVAGLHSSYPSRNTPQFSVPTLAREYLTWLDQQDAHAAQRTLAADTQRVADRVRGTANGGADAR